MSLTFPASALIKKELVSGLRDWKMFLLPFFSAAASVLLVWGAWPSSDVLLQQSATVSSKLMFGFMLIFILCAAAILPGIAGGSVVLEKERGTFEMLRLTLIGGSELLFSKLVSAAAIFLMVLVAVIPIAASAIFLVGIEPSELVFRFLTVMAFSVSCALSGILCSTLFRRGLVAILASYVLMLVPLGVPWGGLAIATELVDVYGLSRDLKDLFVATSPFLALQASLSEVLDKLAANLLWQALFWAACFGAARWALDKRARPEQKRETKVTDDEQVLARRRWSFPFYLIDPMRRKKPIPAGRNPILVRELQWGALGKSDWSIRVLYAATLLFMLFPGVLMFDGTFNYYTRYAVSLISSVILQLCFVTLLCPAILAWSFGREYDSDSMDLLRSTLLTPRQILLGKYLSGLTSTAPIVLAAVLSSAPFLIFFMSWEPKRTAVFAVSFLGTLALCVALTSAVGLFSSIVSRKSNVSMILSYAINLIIFIGLSLGMALLDELDILNTQDDWQQALSPILGFVLNFDHYARYGGFEDEWLPIFIFWWVFAALTLIFSLWLFKRRQRRG